jgi:hypothetical protein
MNTTNAAAPEGAQRPERAPATDQRAPAADQREAGPQPDAGPEFISLAHIWARPGGMLEHLKASKKLKRRHAEAIRLLAAATIPAAILATETGKENFLNYHSDTHAGFASVIGVDSNVARAAMIYAARNAIDSGDARARAAGAMVVTTADFCANYDQHPDAFELMVNTIDFAYIGDLAPSAHDVGYWFPLGDITGFKPLRDLAIDLIALVHPGLDWTFARGAQIVGSRAGVEVMAVVDDVRLAVAAELPAPCFSGRFFKAGEISESRASGGCFEVVEIHTPAGGGAEIIATGLAPVGHREQVLIHVGETLSGDEMDSLFNQPFWIESGTITGEISEFQSDALSEFHTDGFGDPLAVVSVESVGSLKAADPARAVRLGVVPAFGLPSAQG